MSNKENEKKIIMKCINYYNSAVAKQKKIIFINDHWYRNKVIRNENWSKEEFWW